MWTLVDVPGRFPVGATTFAVPLDEGHVIGASKLKLGASSRGAVNAPAVVLKEVVFTAYYPGDISSTPQGYMPSKGMYWLSRCVTLFCLLRDVVICAVNCQAY